MPLTSSSGTVRVLLLARYADLLGHREIRLPIEEAPSTGAVIARVRALPGGEALPAELLVAVNHEQIREDQPLTAGDEVALLPPMAGG
jgi:molybdopterin converting factor small subunit